MFTNGNELLNVAPLIEYNCKFNVLACGWTLLGALILNVCVVERLLILMVIVLVAKTLLPCNSFTTAVADTAGLVLNLLNSK